MYSTPQLTRSLLEVINRDHKKLSVCNSCTIELPDPSSDVDLDTFKECLIESILNLK